MAASLLHVPVGTKPTLQSVLLVAPAGPGPGLAASNLVIGPFTLIRATVCPKEKQTRHHITSQQWRYINCLVIRETGFRQGSSLDNKDASVDAGQDSLSTASGNGGTVFQNEIPVTAICRGHAASRAGTIEETKPSRLVNAKSISTMD